MNSGENYTIAEFFSNDFQISIPDMQRDYCWALTHSDSNGKSLVENFINDLIEQKDIDDTLQMGLLYAYESPKNHVQLCDGQQRITTLYLALGVLYKFRENADILKLLILPAISPEIPRLQYAIRESTLTFLTDLVREVFLNNQSCEPTTSGIVNEDWYFNEYNNDPSIQNIIVAVDFMHKRFTDIEDEEPESINKLIDLLLNKVTFLYFDMVNRTYGEEQFVVLNTTGKPLTVTENIKPKLLGNLDDHINLKNKKTQLRYYADHWEEWELFFWKNKNNKHNTADKGFREFLRWIYIIEKTDLNETPKSSSKEYTESQKALSSGKYNIEAIAQNKYHILDVIQEYFETLELLKTDKQIKKKLLFTDKPLSQIQCFELLPLLLFAKAFQIKDVDNLDYRRFIF